VRFSDPYWLLGALVTSIVLMLIWRRHDRWQQAALTEFVATHLRLKLTGSVSRVGRFMQRALFLAATLCLFAALAGPQVGYHWELISRRGNEVVFAIDTSRSMLTPDVKPNRLTRAKLAIDDMARQLEGDGIGIVAFAGSAFLVCPLTLDYGAFHQSLDAVDVNTIPQGGTDISSAISAARAALRRRPGSDRILILVTDGENLEGDALTAAQAAAQQDGLKIFTVGIGTAEGELIPLPSDLGGGFVKDEKGEVVKSHLDEGGLKAIASAAGGAYVRLEGQGENFDAFLRTVFSAVARHDLLYRQQKVYTERYQWPLAASLVMLLASLVVGTRRLGRRRTAAAVDVARAVAVSVVVGLMVVPARSQSADPGDTTGGKGDAKRPLVEYNKGTTAYRAGQFPQATTAFQQSIKTAPASDAKRLADQEDAYYNLGNALYRSGQRFEKSDPQEAIKQWTDAVKAYETALQLRRDDGDSRYNRDLVQGKIDALRRPPDQGGGGGGGGAGGGGSGAGGGGGKGQGQPQGQGQPPPQGQGQSQGQPTPQNQGQAKGQPPSQGQGQAQAQPPPGQGQAQGQPPQQAPPPQTPPQNSPGGGASPPTQQAGPPPNGSAPMQAENRQGPAQMSPEEARELLDSARGDEHHSLLVPTGPQGQAPEKAIKNW
jgi:Ca-activated chloride channel family protein